jgi:hypothetical protein
MVNLLAIIDSRLISPARGRRPQVRNIMTWYLQSGPVTGALGTKISKNVKVSLL